MIRFTKALAVASAILLVPSIAAALGIQIVNVSGGGADGLLSPGETVTFDLRMDIHTGPALFGVESTVTGYDTPDVPGVRDFGIALDGGVVVPVAYQADVGGTIFGGLTNEQVPGGAPVELFSVNNINPEAYRTLLFGGVSTAPVNGAVAGLADGAGDSGVDGNLVHGVPGDVHFRVTFRNVADFIDDRSTTFQFNVTGIGDGGATIAGTGDSFAIRVIPEPGTALLMGLGLAGLAIRRR